MSTVIYICFRLVYIHSRNTKILGERLPASSIHLVQIYFDTATFDEIERDKKIKFEAQLSLIGGTMGLLTGFSIMSGIEIIFFFFKLIRSLRFTKGEKTNEKNGMI